MFDAREILVPNIANRFRLSGPGAVVGLGDGSLLRNLLRRLTSRAFVYGVTARDNWSGTPQAIASLVPDGRAKLMPLSSVSAARSLSDNHLDWVYLDSARTPDDMLADLNAWYSKVRDGGLIAGRGYYSNQDGGVQSAVDAFAWKMGLMPRYNHERYPSWWVWKGHSARVIGVTGFTDGWPSGKAVVDNRRLHTAATGTPWVIRTYGAMRPGEASYRKLTLVEEVAAENPGAWVFWLDADAVITNLARPLSHLISMTPFDLLLTYDRQYGYNAGAFAVRANVATKIIGQWLDEDQSRWRNVSPWETGALVDLMNRHAFSNCEVVDHRLCNSYPHLGLWGASDLVAHFAGLGDGVHGEIERYAASAKAIVLSQFPNLRWEQR